MLNNLNQMKHSYSYTWYKKTLRNSDKPHRTLNLDYLTTPCHFKYLFEANEYKGFIIDLFCTIN